MPSTVAADLQLRGNQELDEETFARVKEQTGQASAKMRAVRIIAASGVSEKELRRRLVQKGERPEHAEEAVRWLDSLHLLDDRETARQIVARGAARGYGRRGCARCSMKRGSAENYGMRRWHSFRLPETQLIVTYQVIWTEIRMQRP